MIYTNDQNLIRDALGSTFSHVYRWRLFLEEFGPEIVYIKGINNTVADAISWLDYNPMVNPHSSNMPLKTSKELDLPINFLQWQTTSKCLAECDSQCPSLEAHNELSNNIHEELRMVFANYDEDNNEEFYPLTAFEIADAKHANKIL